MNILKDLIYLIFRTVRGIIRMAIEQIGGSQK
jgi:hypothetical protein